MATAEDGGLARPPFKAIIFSSFKYTLDFIEIGIQRTPGITYDRLWLQTQAATLAR